MLQVREITPGFLGEASEILPGLDQHVLLTSIAITEPRRDATESHPLFGVDPIIVFMALISCFCITSFLQSKY